MKSIDEKQMEQLLNDLVEIGVLAVSAEKKAAERGGVYLTIYPSEKEVEQAVKDYLTTVDLVSVKGQITTIRYDQTFFGLDFLGDIPLFVDEDVEFRHSGEVKQGYGIEQGLSQLHAIFEPRTKEELEEVLQPSEFTGGVQL
ncbi:hypothetical protein [Halobacterium salinarum]|uniref:hypothetical protein n=1 Tax=Halobacterium salinarum TaxID=2242 RepID=UPI002555989C|nr:hypothetical protein [Halobacterium salinarum]MDL0145778.1 hypothetical protein [Halobacterium salinarum]